MAYIGEQAIEIDPIEVDNVGSFAELIISELPMCDDAVVREKLGFALREFCRETDACTVEQKAFAKDNQRELRLFCIPSGMLACNVVECTVNGDGVPYRFVGGDRVAVERILSEGDLVRFVVSVVPAAGGEKCPKWFKRKYAEAICAGAKYHLLSMTKRPWSDPARAVQCATEYHNAIIEASYSRIEASSRLGGSVSCIPSGGLFI